MSKWLVLNKNDKFLSDVKAFWQEDMSFWGGAHYLQGPEDAAEKWVDFLVAYVNNTKLQQYVLSEYAEIIAGHWYHHVLPEFGAYPPLRFKASWSQVDRLQQVVVIKMVKELLELVSTDHILRVCEQVVALPANTGTLRQTLVRSR